MCNNTITELFFLMTVLCYLINKFIPKGEVYFKQTTEPNCASNSVNNISTISTEKHKVCSLCTLSQSSAYKCKNGSVPESRFSTDARTFLSTLYESRFACEIIWPTKIGFVDENRKLFNIPLYNQKKELNTQICSFTQEVL